MAFANLSLDDGSELEKLRKENRELKRQLGGAGLGSGLNIDYDQLDVQDQIGGGGFSTVHRGFWNGTPVAIKKWFDPNMGDKLMIEFREEVMTAAELRHPHVVQFLGACMTPPNLLMVTEHMPHNLHGVLHETRVNMDHSKLIDIASDCARALIYLHGQKPPVAHKDVKPGNFLLDRAWKVKICDFGLAGNSNTHGTAGTPAYMAPELFTGGAFNTKVDIYAMGIMLNEMMSRQLPWAGLGVQEIKSRISSGGRPELGGSCPTVIGDIIKKCWAQDPADRPTSEELLSLLKASKRQL